jgi:D-glycero-D-manno-heptose 1,7-bisphosphate phosphatase
LPERSSASPRRAVFLDRDGTILDEVGYVNHICRYSLYSYSPAAIRRLNDAGLPVMVVSNQSGVSRGFFPESLVHDVHRKLDADLAAAGAHIDAYYFCPHTGADNCPCRKPKTGMMEDARRAHNLRFDGSFMIGDRGIDMEMAHTAGVRSILLLSGYGHGDYEYHRHEWSKQPEFVVETLADAVEIVLGEMVR